jgi:alpha-tubulin suppressor-like RCC1 family protein
MSRQGRAAGRGGVWTAAVATVVSVASASVGLLAAPAVAYPPAQVYSAGNNVYGQLGDGRAPTPSGVFVSASYFPISVKAVAGGGVSAYALRADGTVWAWGRNDYGQLGNGTTVDSHTPVQVPGLTEVKAVAGGGVSAYALRADGTVWAWGRNDYGQLGNGTTVDSHTPVQVPGLTEVKAISAGCWTGYALRDDGSVWAWGHNAYGQLGNGGTANALAPAQVPGLPKVTLIAGGRWAGYAKGADGTLWSWGANWHSQLGDGQTYTSRPTPGRVTENGIDQSKVTALASSGDSAYALLSDGTVLAWGRNDLGQLGLGVPSERFLPNLVQNLPASVVAIAAAGDAAYAVLADRTVWAWGRGDLGQLGDGALTTSYDPVPVPGLPGGAAAVGGGGFSGYLIVDQIPGAPPVNSDG